MPTVKTSLTCHAHVEGKTRTLDNRDPRPQTPDPRSQIPDIPDTGYRIPDTGPRSCVLCICAKINNFMRKFSENRKYWCLAHRTNNFT